MINNPYQVLGISSDATPEEIKRAYRKKAKEYHPDLHPNDPAAAQKMNEINEAYDMLQNPEKYKARQEREANQHQDSQQNRYEYHSSQTNSGGYRNYGGWTSDFGGFDFENVFGFGNTHYDTMPRQQAGDTPDMVEAIRAVQNRQYRIAIDILLRMTSNCRNNRWYYVSAYAYNGLGENVRARDFIEKAIQMNPENRVYRQLYREISQGARCETGTYYSGPSVSPLRFLGKIILGILGFRLLTGLLQWLIYGIGRGFAH